MIESLPQNWFKTSIGTEVWTFRAKSLKDAQDKVKARMKKIEDRKGVSLSKIMWEKKADGNEPI